MLNIFHLSWAQNDPLSLDKCSWYTSHHFLLPYVMAFTENCLSYSLATVVVHVYMCVHVCLILGLISKLTLIVSHTLSFGEMQVLCNHVGHTDRCTGFLPRVGHVRAMLSRAPLFCSVTVPPLHTQTPREFRKARSPPLIPFLSFPLPADFEVNSQISHAFCDFFFLEFL